jgi:arylsulfatase A-like enzyme
VGDPLRRWLLVALAAGLALAVPLLLRGTAPPDAEPQAAPSPGAVGARPNVIVMLVDTLRADHLGMYGYERDTSPALDEWAAGAVVFQQAYALSSWTRPSTVSLLTGLDPIHHRVEDRLDVIPQHVRLLSERLKERGYATFGAITNPHVSAAWAFDRGFDDYVDLKETGRGTAADAVADHVIALGEALAASQPFFLYLHLIDPHTPFDPPPPYDTLFADDPDDAVEWAIGGYDGEIAFVDEQLGRMLAALRARGLEDDTLTILVSDHGEELMERGNIGHGVHLFEEVVRVPLVIRFPGGAHGGLRVPQRVSLIDVVPTLLARLGDTPPEDMDGRDLSPLLDERRRSWADRELFLSIRTTGPSSNLIRGVLDGPRKYLRRSRPEASESLYDLERDPAEHQDLADALADTRARMAALLDATLGRRASGVHLRLVNAPDGEPVRCEVRLTTTGRFVDVVPVRLEDGDDLALGDDGRELRLGCRLENRVLPTNRGSRLQPDEDGLAFQVQPPDAPIVVQNVALDGGRELPLRGGAQRVSETYPLTLVATEDAWSVRDMGEAMSAAGPVAEGEVARAYLGVIRPPRTQGLSDDLRARLRELGYVTETGIQAED